MALGWLADDSLFLVVFGSSLPHYLKKIVVRVGPPLAKFPGAAHANHMYRFVRKVKDIVKKLKKSEYLLIHQFKLVLDIQKNRFTETHNVGFGWEINSLF